MRLAHLALLLATLAPAAAQAEGLALHDLSGLPADVSQLTAGAWEWDIAADRATFFCFGCPGETVIDIQTSRQTDGTEARLRSGETSFGMLQDQCQQRDPACRLEGLQVDPAVGWMTSYAIGGQSAHTIVVIRDGDLMTARVLGSDPAIVRQNADAVVAHMLPVIIGD